MTSPRLVDPLTVFPPEIVLQILEHTPVSGLASLTATSKAWHRFIDVTHQEAIYTSESKTSQPPGSARDLSFLPDTHSFAKLFEGTTSWKDLCKRQTLLARNWAGPYPAGWSSTIQVGDNPVWRFRADFKRRFFISTSHNGGLTVTDMDTGCIIWSRPSLDNDSDGVRPHAHLEYQDGMAVFDSEGDSIEVWQTDQEGTKRGEFRRIAILKHDCQTRGFQLSYWTLCVVSNEGQGFVYDMTQRPPKLTTKLNIERGGIGHLDQSADVVIYSMGAKGYFAYNKESGAFLGSLKPPPTLEKYHVRLPAPEDIREAAALERSTRKSRRPPHALPGGLQEDCLVPIQVNKGPLPIFAMQHIRHEHDDWGAGMLDGNLFVGISRGGRVFICSDFRKALRDEASLVAHSSIVECYSDVSSFDLGGWLSVRNHRVMFESEDRVYILALDDNNRVQNVDNPPRASYSLLTSTARELAVPVSYMALADDAIMTTYTTFGQRTIDAQDEPRHRRVFPTKVIRIVSLAPVLSPRSDDNVDSTEGEEGQSRIEDLFNTPAGMEELARILGDEALRNVATAAFDSDDEGEMHEHAWDILHQDDSNSSEFDYDEDDDEDADEDGDDEDEYHAAEEAS
ncbi:uncharacterized protein N7515_002693 [Penicillium bovifimosum]|uniref:F-box domain-containing protein n=1 Tax=Penicillium bovifimosum TaxID=126998 RepID=A0A9W9HC14_9EURO|nr:uncharacterized protein N7515_002693 [Penicillium bovifimosum]KAJ5143906.1 hypothetical protein N7515_002693 [Penicillium bovifimosum]